MKLPIKLSQHSREPIYHQIEEQLKAIIAGGYLAAGTPLPSIRVLAKDLKISVITTRRAYQNLENAGFIKTVQGKGTFVEDISENLKEELKVETVYENFEKAIETAFSYNYTHKQIEAIFKQAMRDYDEQKGYT